MKLSKKEKLRLQNDYGEWAVITGASSGIGKELTRLLCESGLNVVLVARNKEALDILKIEVEKNHGITAETIVADLGNAEFAEVYQSTKNKKVGLFVASAGFGTSGEFIENSVQTESNMIQVNCVALMQMTHFFAQKFVAQNKGGIILLSSMVAFQGVPFSANYAATKAYVQSLAEGLYHELKPKGVDVLAAAPGPVKSGFAARANMNMDMYLTTQQIGVPVLKALGRKMTVLPGNLTKMLVYSLRTVPRYFKIKIMKLVMNGMTKHQEKTGTTLV